MKKKILILAPVFLLAGSLIGCGGGGASDNTPTLAITAPKVTYVGDIDKNAITAYEVIDGKTTLVKPEDLTLSVTKFDQRSDSLVPVTVTSKNGAKGTYLTKVYDVFEVDEDIVDNVLNTLKNTNSHIESHNLRYGSDGEVKKETKTKYTKFNDHEICYDYVLEKSSNDESVWKVENAGAYQKGEDKLTGETIYYTLPIKINNNEEVEYIINKDLPLEKTCRVDDECLLLDTSNIMTPIGYIPNYSKLIKDGKSYKYSNEMDTKKYTIDIKFNRGKIDSCILELYSKKDTDFKISNKYTLTCSFDNISDPFKNMEDLKFTYMKFETSEMVKKISELNVGDEFKSQLNFYKGFDDDYQPVGAPLKAEECGFFYNTKFFKLYINGETSNDFFDFKFNDKNPFELVLKVKQVPTDDTWFSFNVYFENDLSDLCFYGCLSSGCVNFHVTKD